jgi:glycosyltransferase involved in cell wall biosynthesis
MTLPHRRLRITFVLPDLAGSAIGRAAPVASALREDHLVDAVGLLAPGSEPYPPYRDELPVEAIPGSARDPRALVRLARRIQGDVVVACKPLPATLIPALAAGRRGSRAVLLDVDDDEWSEVAVEPGTGARRRVARMLDVHGLVARAVHPLTRWVDGVTVSSRALQRRYGGALIRHGPDGRLFDPGRFTADDRRGVRARFGLPPEAPLAVFAGVPRVHKGWETLVAALERSEAAAWTLVGVGERGGDRHALAAARLGARFHLLPPVPRAELPLLLAAMDAAPVPQRAGRYAESQLPAKLLDAMAMALPVVASGVGDLPEILGEGDRGWLLPPDDAPALAGALARLAADPAEAARRGRAARVWLLAEASVEANRSRLGAVVRAALERRAARNGARAPSGRG